MGVNLHIGELILEGFHPGDRFAIAEAMQRELVHLLTTEGIPRSFEVAGPVQFQVGRQMRPAAIGEGIARSVYRGWMPVERTP